MTTIRSLILSLFLFAAAGLQAAENLRIPAVFSDNMVLQRDLEVPVWGWCSPGSKITVRFAGKEYNATAGNSGKWSTKLAASPASTTPSVLEIEEGETKIKFKNVLIGDVWICSGQSNMEWSVKASANPKEEIAAANHPNIRVFNVPNHETSSVPLQKLKTPGNWQPATPGSITNFSAVGYYFGRAIQEADPSIPIGLIGTNWGGTRVEPWTPSDAFARQPELAEFAKKISAGDPKSDAGKQVWKNYFQAMEEWKKMAELSLFEEGKIPPQPQMPGNQRSPGSMIYNAMVAPLIPYGVRGAIWYQGESNGGEGLAYQPKLQALIDGWRTNWNQPDDFPFYFYIVQLANFGQPKPDQPAAGDGYAAIRIAQKNLLTSMDHTGLACIIDIGEARDIHPKNKQDVGKRLARWAIRDVLGKTDTVVSGPIYKNSTIADGKVTIEFDHVGSGLMIGKKVGLAPTEDVSSEGKLSQFALAGEDGKWHWANAAIAGNTVVVSSPNVSAPVHVRYAYAHNPEGANLYNKEGLPAVPFKTDK